MVLLHFRVHYTPSQGGQNMSDDMLVKSFLLNNSSVVKCIIGNEVNATRPHLQCFIDYNKTTSTFRQQFKKEFPNKQGNTDYSLKEVENLESMMSYVCKEGNVIFKGFSEEEKASIKPWVEKSDYKKSQQKKINGNCNQAVVEQLRAKYPTNKWEYNPYDMAIIVSEIQRVYGAGFKQLSSMKVRDNALGVLNSLNTGSLHNKLFSEAFPDLFLASYVPE